MAWTAPRTWVHAEIVSAAQMNTHVRDNLLETAPAKATAQRQTVFSTGVNAISMVANSILKSGDQSINNSTVLVNDAMLAGPMAANEWWSFRIFLYFTVASGTPGYRLKFNVPAGCTGWYRLDDLADNIDAAGFTGTNAAMYNRALATEVVRVQPALTSFLAVLQGVAINGGTAGNLWLQWAQQTAVASNLTLKAGSYMDIKRLA